MLSLLKNSWVRTSGALVISGTLVSGCVGGPPLTQSEGQAAGAAIGALLGTAAAEALGSDSHLIDGALIGGGAVLGGVYGGAAADRQRVCSSEGTTQRTARRDNRTGRVIYDETDQSETENCQGGRRVGRAPANQPIF